MVSAVWSVYCSEYAKKNGVSYREALVEARESYYIDNKREVPALKKRKKKEKDEESVDNVNGVPKKKRAYKKRTVVNESEQSPTKAKPKIIMQPKAPAKKTRKPVQAVVEEEEDEVIVEPDVEEIDAKPRTSSKQSEVQRKRRTTSK